MRCAGSSASRRCSVPPSGCTWLSTPRRWRQPTERPGFITITGSKLTTYRPMALEVVDRAGHQLGKIPSSTTADRPLPGAEGIAGDEDLARLAGELQTRGIDERTARHLSLTY